MRVCSPIVLALVGASALSTGSVFAKGGESSSVPAKPLIVEQKKRTVGALDSEALLSLDDLEKEAEQPKSDKPSNHQRGGRPREPAAQLPEEIPITPPSEKARVSIAQGATTEKLAKGAPDEQLDELRVAEKVLFPRPVRGLESGWSFELPTVQDQASRTLGLPLRLTTEGVADAFSQEDIAWLRSLTLPDLPVRLDRRVVTYLKFYRDSDRGRTIAAIWARKSGRYVAEMKAKLRRAGLPTDLVWLSMIESGHNPTIESPAGAVGLWQFIPTSGRMYGLTVDRWVDERRDPARSTQAAIRFLSDLHQRFGNWELAMGAYNMGYAGMSRAVAKYNTNDYWTLSRMESGIPWETTLYVPKIFALAIVMNNREAFGVGRTPLDPAEAFDSILLEPATPLSDAARAAGISLGDLQKLNPQFLADRLPPQDSGEVKKWPVRVPRGSGESTLAKMSKQGVKTLEQYRVRQGDDAAVIAAEYGVSEAALIKENALGDAERLEPGTVLLLPTGAKKVKSPPQTDVVVSRNLTPAKGQEAVFYVVRPGDQLVEIAAAFSVNQADLAAWNMIDTSAHLQEGMTLQVLVDDAQKLTDVRFVRESEARLFLAGSPEFHEHFESLKGKSRVQITVADGDTLMKLGARYGMTVGSMERVNRRSRSTQLVVGEKLIVYTDRKDTAEQQANEPGELPKVVAPRPDLLP